MWVVIAISAAAAVGSLIFDTIAIRWHYQDRKRMTNDEALWQSNSVADPRSTVASQFDLSNDGVGPPFGFGFVVTAKK